MVTYADFTTFSNIPIEADFPYIEERSVDLLSMLCGSRWDENSAVCKKAVLYQCEYVAQNGGLIEWSKGRGAVGNHSWSVGGESESYTYVQSTIGAQAKTFNGLAVSPIAWQLLVDNGFLKTLRSVRVL